MSPTHHSMNYVELTVNDLTVAKTFYESAFGWEFNDYGPSYAGIRGSNGTEVGGIFESTDPRPETSGVVSPFVILFSNNLDESLRGIVESGGQILQDPYEFPGGRRLHFADPSGNELGVWSEQ